MDIIWDKEKNEWLKLNRQISFDEIAEMILNGYYKALLENPARENQFYFILEINEYTWVVPFILDQKDKIVLKTAFPSRKFHKKFGGK
ncbi:MAG: toxin [Calditrichaeota bacterium]|nr:toxin [Calditrichota bacterium]